MLTHNYSIDLLRILSAFLIVWYHAKAAGGSIAYAGIVCFIEIAAYFSYYNSIQTGFLRKRAVRLLFPWVVWSLIYGFLNVAKGNPYFGTNAHLLNTIFAGTYIHLWYLPYLFIISYLIVFLRLMTRPSLQSLTARFMGLAVPCVALIIVHILRVKYTVGQPWAAWIHAFPAVLIGLVIGIIQDASIADTMKNVLHWSLLALISIISIVIGASGEIKLGIPYLLGTILTIGAFKVKIKKFPLIQTLADLTMGIYLIHLLVIALLHYFCHVINTPELLAVVAFGVSLVVIFVTNIVKLQIVHILIGTRPVQS